MAFAVRDASVADGMPVRLYEFTRGALGWRYCTADRDVTWRGVLWRSAAIVDDGVRITGEASADALKVTAPGDLEVARLYRGAPPSAEIGLTVRDLHWGDPDALASARVVWSGSVSQVSWPQQDRAALVCESISASMERPGLRMRWERGCPHTVYDRRCGLDRNQFGVAATLQGADALRVSSGVFAGYPDGHFAGGVVAWGIGSGEVERRGVERHLGSDLWLLGGAAGLGLGLVVTAYPGCRQTAEYCDTVFGNVANFGGFRHMPGKSPFDGDPVF